MANTTAWGYFYGKEMMWLPIAYPLGAYGTVIDFTGPYPQTIYLAGDYYLSPSQHPIENLNIATFVQYSSGTREVLNADYMDMPDDPTGISGDQNTGVDSPNLHVGPNPSNGEVAIGCLLPSGAAGTIRIFDMNGRLVHQAPAQENATVTLEESGIYFVQLYTDDGQSISRQLTVLR